MKFTLKNYIKKLKFIFKQLFKSGSGFLFLVIFAALFNGASPVFTTLIISNIIVILESSLITPLNYQNVYLRILISLMFMSVIISLFTNSVKAIISELTSHKLSHNVQTMIAAKFQKIPQKIVDSPNFQDLYKNTADKVLTEPVNVVETLLGLISCCIGILGYVSILFSLNILSVISMITMIIPIYFLKNKSTKLEFDFIKKNTKEMRQVYYNYYLLTDNQITKEVRIFNLFEYLNDKRNQLFKKLLIKRKNIARKQIFTLVITTLLLGSSALFTEYVLIKSVMEDFTPISKFILYNTAIISLVTELFKFVDLIVSNNRSLKFIDYLFKFLELPTETKVFYQKNSLINDSQPLRIGFCNVYFKYPGALKNSVEEISFKLNTGEKLCLVGENGSGKSTLVKLLLRIYKPTKGKILINDKDIENYEIEGYKKIFGVIFQDFIKYFATIQENIGFGDVDGIENLEKIKKISQKLNQITSFNLINMDTKRI